MARRRSSNPFQGAAGAELDMSPLIDVAFLLLIYFLVATTLNREEADLSLALPGTSAIGGDPVKIDLLTVRIDAQSQVWVNNDLVEQDLNRRELAALMDRLVRYRQSAAIAKSQPMVIIDCAGEAKEKRFVDVLNACTRAGIHQLTLSN